MIVPWFGIIIPKTKCESTEKFAEQTCFSVSESNAWRDPMRFLRSLHTINRNKQPKLTVVYLVEMSKFLVCQQSEPNFLGFSFNNFVILPYFLRIDLLNFLAFLNKHHKHLIFQNNELHLFLNNILDVPWLLFPNPLG